MAEEKTRHSHPRAFEFHEDCPRCLELRAEKDAGGTGEQPDTGQGFEPPRLEGETDRYFHEGAWYALDGEDNVLRWSVAEAEWQLVEQPPAPSTPSEPPDGETVQMSRADYERLMQRATASGAAAGELDAPLGEDPGGEWGPWQQVAGPKRTTVVTINGAPTVVEQAPPDPEGFELAREPRRFTGAEFQQVLKLKREHLTGKVETVYLAFGRRYYGCIGHMIAGQAGGRREVFDLYPSLRDARRVALNRERAENKRREAAAGQARPQNAMDAITYGMESGAYPHLPDGPQAPESSFDEALRFSELEPLPPGL